MPNMEHAFPFCTSKTSVVALAKKGNPFLREPFLVEQPPKKWKKGATEQLRNQTLKDRALLWAPDICPEGLD